MPLKKCGRIRKSYSKTSSIKKSEVLRILKVIMENKSSQTNSSTATSMQAINVGDGAEGVSVPNINADNFNDFFNTGRIGRRNALPDILSMSCATTSTADLPEKFNALTTTDVVMSTNNSTNKGNGATLGSSSSTSLAPTTSSNICSNSNNNYNDNNVNPT